MFTDFREVLYRAINPSLWFQSYNINLWIPVSVSLEWEYQYLPLKVVVRIGDNAFKTIVTIIIDGHSQNYSKLPRF